MGWFSNLFKKQEEKINNSTYAEVLNGYSPIFSQFGTNIYASDVVQQAISCIVSEIKKLKPTHIREVGTDVVSVNGDIQAVLNNPNPLMTTSDFLEKVTWLLYLNYNAFIVPTYYEWRDSNGTLQRKYDGLYPIQPSQVDFIEDAGGRLFVRFYFNNGTDYIIKYSDIIHVKKNYSVNQYMGGNEAGQPDNEALLKTLNLNYQLLEGVSSAMKSSFAINGVIKYNTMLDDGKTEEALKQLEAKLKKSESGFLPLDLKAEFIPIKKELQLVDSTTLKFIDEKILRNFGVPLCILTGDYTKSQYEAFYQKTLEPIIISLSQAFTKVLFTDNQLSRGNKIQFYPKELIFMSVEQTLEMVTLLSNTGALYENEKRVAFGLKPLPELEGKRYMSLNWVDMEIANQYQTDALNEDNTERQQDRSLLYRYNPNHDSKTGKFAPKSGGTGGSVADKFTSSNPKDFKNALDKAKASQNVNKRWRVDNESHSEADYSNDKLFTTKGGSTVAITPDGDIISVCRNTDDNEVKGIDLMKMAVENGGKKLDSFAENHGFYSKCGFEPVSWCKFDDDFAPTGWKESGAEKEAIIFYKYTGKTSKFITAEDFTKSVKASDDYDTAQSVRDNSLKKEI